MMQKIIRSKLGGKSILEIAKDLNVSITVNKNKNKNKFIYLFI